MRTKVSEEALSFINQTIEDFRRLQMKRRSLRKLRIKDYCLGLREHECVANQTVL